MSTGVLQGPDELACRSPHDRVHDAVCIFVPAQIFPDGKCLIFDFSKCLGTRISLVDTAVCIAYVRYIQEPR